MTGTAGSIWQKGEHMDFDLTEEQKMLKANIRNFLEKEIVPVADEC